MNTNGFGPPFPFNPFPDLDLYTSGTNPPSWSSLGTNSWIVDDRTVDYDAIWAAKFNIDPSLVPFGLKRLSGAGGGQDQRLKTLGTQTSESLSFPGDPGGDYGGDDTNSFDPAAAYSYPQSNALWLEVTQQTNGWLGVVVHGTVPFVEYDLLSKPSLTNATWSLEGTLLGTDNQDFTFTWVSKQNRSNLFLWAKSWADNDGSGMPDWWQLQNFGHTGVDPYGDPDGDGWTNIQEYQNGTNPNGWTTPGAPSGLTVRYAGSSSNVLVTWFPSPGNVTGYRIHRNIPELLYQEDDFEISASATNFLDSPFPLPHPTYDFRSVPPTYSIFAHYGSHQSFTSDDVSLWPSLAGGGTVVRGAGGKLFFVLSGSVQTNGMLRIVRSGGASSDVIHDIPWSSLSNGGFQLPDSWIDTTGGSYGWLSIIIQTNATELQTLGYDSVSAVPFYDGRIQMKQNLAFLLREADTISPLNLEWTDGSHPLRFKWDTNYVFAAVNEYAQTANQDVSYISPPPPELEPFFFNSLFRNLVFASTNVDTNGFLNTGVSSSDDFEWITLNRNLSTFTLDLNSLGTNLPSLPGAGDSRWLLSHPFYPGADGFFDGNYIGLESSSLGARISTGSRNLYGLPFSSVKCIWGNSTTQTVTIASTSSWTPWGETKYWYSEVSAPQLETVDYYFARRTGPNDLDAIPGDGRFSVTNTSGLIILPFGESSRVAAYARQRIVNGYTNKFAYLGQYFESAFAVNEDGSISTNNAGILSPFGEFFPTLPGRIALVTMPDIDTGQRGTGYVFVAKLQLDANHDGKMDLSLTGPDNTSVLAPFKFWLNNDFDRWHAVANAADMDDLSDQDRDSRDPFSGKPQPDCEYRDSSSSRIIPSTRDLEDFARLWICGVSTNLFPYLPPGVTAELSWGDKGNPDTNNPTIDIFSAGRNPSAPDRYGSDSYLTNIFDATYQTNRQNIGTRLGPGDSLAVLHGDSYGYSYWNRAIWCAVKPGSGTLKLTLTLGTNRIAEVSAYVQIKDIKQMYERWSVGDEPKNTPTNRPYPAADFLPVGTGPFRYGPPESSGTPYILLVHEYDLPRWKKDRFAETAYKRLYWQGYQGRFGFFRWPGVTDSQRPLDDSEFNAWRSSAGLLNLLASLNTQYTTNVHLMAHGYGTIAAGEALRMAGTNHVVETYIAMQGAVPSHSYDLYAPGRSLGTADDHTPNRYINYYTNNAPTYFWNGGGASAYINYFSTNDFVLTNLWRLTQDSKPDFLYHWNGTNFLFGYLPAELLLFPADTYEIFSFCDEARCEAIGAQPNLYGPFRTLFEVDLSATPYFFGGKEKDHSAQFLSDCASRWEFWHSVLRSMGLKQ